MSRPHAEHDHTHEGGGWDRLGHRLRHWAWHSHDPNEVVDREMEASARGVRAVALSFVALAVTAAVQAVVVVLSHSVALLGDTLHNLADALTAVPLAFAFWVGRRSPTRRFTYGYGRVEDVAGLVVVAFVAASSVAACYAAVRRLVHPEAVTHLWAVALAALIGFVGNEAVAHYRISVGRQIGSAALVADGLHARTDGLTSLGVLVGAGGVAIGWSWADPLVGLLIAVAILGVLRSAAAAVFARLLDAVDPHLVTHIEQVLRAQPGVRGVDTVRLRWIGHSLHAQAEIAVDPSLSVTEAHEIAHAAEHRLLHEVHRLAAVIVHAGPDLVDPAAHQAVAHHRAGGSGDRASPTARG